MDALLSLLAVSFISLMVAETYLTYEKYIQLTNDFIEMENREWTVFLKETGECTICTISDDEPVDH